MASSVQSSSSTGIRRVIAALVLTCVVFAGITSRPASADGAASTRNIILGAAAVAAAVIITNNIHHKQVARNTVVGHTRDGGTVYADGHIAYPNGNVLYTSNGNGRPCTWSGDGNRCGAAPVAYYPAGYGAAHRHDYGDDSGSDRHHQRDDRGHDHRGHDHHDGDDRADHHD